MENFDYQKTRQAILSTGVTVAEIAEQFEAVARLLKVQEFARFWVEEFYPVITEVRNTPEFREWHKRRYGC